MTVASSRCINFHNFYVIRHYLIGLYEGIPEQATKQAAAANRPGSVTTTDER